METINKTIKYDPDFGYSVCGNTLGEAWVRTVECVMKNGLEEADESRDRKALQNFRIKSHTQNLPDPIFEKYGKKENIEAMINLVFKEPVMKDFDVVTNFRVGAKSYKTRLEEGNMLNFVIGRLAKIPESKKAVMVFPTYEDYKQVLGSPFNDYLPCIVSVQFRLRPEENGVQKLNTIFNMRSWNIDQKGAGDLTIMAILTKRVAEELSKKLEVKVIPGSLDALVTDIHVYKETYEQAQTTVDHYNRDLQIEEQSERWGSRANTWEKEITSPNHYANFEGGYEKFLKLEEQILSKLAPVKTAIDLGCGTGQTSKLLENKAETIYILDIAGKMLDEAKKRVPKAIPLLASVTSIPLPNESVDIAISRGVVVSHLPSSLTDSFFTELGRVVRQSGKIMFDYISNLESVDFKNQSPKITFTKKEMREKLEQNGFINIISDGHVTDRVMRVIADKR